MIVFSFNFNRPVTNPPLMWYTGPYFSLGHDFTCLSLSLLEYAGLYVIGNLRISRCKHGAFFLCFYNYNVFSYYHIWFIHSFSVIVISFWNIISAGVTNFNSVSIKNLTHGLSIWKCLSIKLRKYLPISIIESLQKSADKSDYFSFSVLTSTFSICVVNIASIYSSITAIYNYAISINCIVLFRDFIYPLVHVFQLLL